MNAKEQVRVLSRGIAELISPEYLESKIQKSIQSKRPLIVKAGFDPSSRDIHLGHTVLLNKLRQFQDLGHEVVFIIGDATARIGDPSGTVQTRPMLTPKEIKDNAKTYQKQAFKILNPKRTKTVYNNQWFGEMPFYEMMMLASKITVSQILQRDDFQKRIQTATPISLIEIFYPLMQAYDSVQIKADIELGGTDQKFNLLLGRELQRELGQDPQAIMTLPLLVGLDGQQKMSKSLGNHVGITETASEMFGKVMSVSDDLMVDYYTLLTDVPGDEVQKKIKKGELHPKNAKEELATKIVTRFHSTNEAEGAKSEFQKVFAKHENPTDMPEIALPRGEVTILDLVSRSGAVSSGNEARRLILQKAVSVDGQTYEALDSKVTIGREALVLKVGKRRFIKILPD